MKSVFPQVNPALPRQAPETPALQRWSEHSITPFEVWDLVVGQSVWAEQFYQPDFGRYLSEGIAQLSAGRGITRSRGPVPALVGGFDAVFLTGGRANSLETLIENIPARCFFGVNGAFEGVVGGMALLEARGVAGWALDLGQSHLKLATRGHKWAFQRDSTRLRAHGEISSAEIPAQRRRLCDFIALKLQWALAHEPERPGALVAGLPARLAEDGTPLGGNYAGLRGYREVIPDALELAGLRDVRTFVMNDAELAAFSACADPRLTAFRKILVLTLGFGIGAALVSRAS